MYHLIYTSEATEEFHAPDLKKLLTGARLRNADAGVTGMLVYHAGVFLQALEGEEAAVQAVFARIGKDARHGNVHVLHQSQTIGKRRKFGDWAMGYSDSTGAGKLMKGFVEMQADLSKLNDASAMELLEAAATLRQAG